MNLNTQVQYKRVTCRTCGRSYVCTPADDYYGATTLTDGQCERCLIGDTPLVHVQIQADGSGRLVPRPGSGVN